MTIRYLSFDFDGCLFNSTYIRLGLNNQREADGVLVTNRNFLNRIKEENAQFSSVFALIGSTRQDYETDVMNGILQNKGSCFPAMVTICNDLGITLDPFLLSDIEGDLKAGTSFNYIMDEINNDSWFGKKESIHKHAFLTKVDEFKRTILFAQMQKAAADHPNEEIIFDFFDDRLDILRVLQDYFTQHPHMMPKNVRLRLNAYAGEDSSLRAELTGEGNPISNYRFYIKKMHENVYALDEVAESIKKTSQQTPEDRVMSILEEVIGRGLFLKSRDEIESFFTAHPYAHFVVHPSRYKTEDLFTFTATYKVDGTYAHIRYGLDINGKLFVLDDKQRIEIEMHQDGLFATLAMHTQVAKQSVEKRNESDKSSKSAVEKQEKMSTGEALFQEITNSPYFVNEPKLVKLESPKFFRTFV